MDNVINDEEDDVSKYFLMEMLKSVEMNNEPENTDKNKTTSDGGERTVI